MIFIIKILEFIFDLPKSFYKKLFLFFTRERLLWIMIVILVIFYALLPIRSHLFNVRWGAFASSKNSISVEQMMRSIVTKCGNGTSLTRLVIGKEKNLQDAITLINNDYEDSQVLVLDKAFSCNKDRTRFREDDDCILSKSELLWINPIYGKTFPIDKETLEMVNSDYLELGNINYEFNEHQPIWINLRNNDGELTYEAKDLRKKAPLFYSLIKVMRERMDKVGAVKTKNYFNDVVYIFILSFWNNEWGAAERSCVNNLGSESRLLEELSRTQKKVFN